MATSLSMLSDDCISTILSLTSPSDACRSMLACSSLRSAAESDTVWVGFLPADLARLLLRTCDRLGFCSKKELFFLLCGSVLVDGGIRAFSLSKVSGKISYVLSARALSISLSNEPNHWTWTTHSTSRFPEAIELKTISNIEIEGTIDTQDLSPNTTYASYLIIKVSNGAFGLDSIPSETSVTKGETSVTSNTAFLCPLDDRKQQLESLFFMNRRRMMDKLVAEGENRRPSKRSDGWLEVEVGEFYVGEKSERVKMNVKEVKGHQLKGGLVIEGIEVRPKC